MLTGWSCSECGTKTVKVATICIYEEQTGEFVDFCFECGMKALQQRFLELGEKEVVGEWHITIPDLREKQHVSVNYLPDVIED